MVNRNKNYLDENKRAGNNGDAFENDPNKGINEAQDIEKYASGAIKDGGVIAKDAALIAGITATGGAGAAGAGAATGTAGATAGAGGAAAATATEGAVASGATVAEGSSALSAAGESTVTSGVSDSALNEVISPSPDAKELVENVDPAAETRIIEDVNKDANVSNNLENTDAAKTDISEDKLGDKKDGLDKSDVKEKTKSSLEENIKDEIKKEQGAKKTVSEEVDFYKSKNFMDKNKRSEKMRLAQQKIDDKGKDDRGIAERMQDKQVSQNGFSQLDATGNAADIAGRAAGSVVDAGMGGKTNARESLGGMGSELTGAAGRLQNTSERQVTKLAKFALRVPLVGVAAFITVPLLLLLSFASFGVTVAATSAVAYGEDVCMVNDQSSTGAGEVITPGKTPESSGGFSWDKLTDEQKNNATQIAKQAASRSLPAQAVVIAYATVMQESRFISVNYGDIAGPDSRGLFQQRDSWGTLEQRMDPFQSAGLFFDRLVAVPNWQTIPVTLAAQSVQISAFPDAYAKHELDARNVLANVVTNSNPYASELSSYPEWVSGAGGIVADESKCGETTGAFPTGTWASPFCNNPSIIVSNYFGPRTLRGGYSFHTGMDMYVAGDRNAPLCAAAAGVVDTVKYAPRDCGNYIIIKTDDNLYYDYCHLKDAPLLVAGDRVEVGTPIGLMGTTGNSTGEHLHFEVSKLGGQGTNAANPMCLFKGKPDILSKMDFTRDVEMTVAGYDYRCENRSDLDAWSRSQ